MYGLTCRTTRRPMWSALISRRRSGLCLADGFTTTLKRLTSSAGRLALELPTCSQGLLSNLSKDLCCGCVTSTYMHRVRASQACMEAYSFFAMRTFSAKTVLMTSGWRNKLTSMPCACSSCILSSLCTHHAVVTRTTLQGSQGGCCNWGLQHI